MSDKEQEDSPWASASERYAQGQMVSGSITRVVPFGVFVRLEEGIEGFVPRAELPSWVNPLQNLHEGQRLQLRVLELEPALHRMKLSLLQKEMRL